MENGFGLLNIGFNNSVALSRVVAIISAESSPMKRLREEAKQARLLVDGTNGRKTRSIVVMNSNHVVLSSVEAETLSARARGKA